MPCLDNRIFDLRCFAPNNRIFSLGILRKSLVCFLYHNKKVLLLSPLSRGIKRLWKINLRQIQYSLECPPNLQSLIYIFSQECTDKLAKPRLTWMLAVKERIAILYSTDLERLSNKEGSRENTWNSLGRGNRIVLMSRLEEGGDWNRRGQLWGGGLMSEPSTE